MMMERPKPQTKEREPRIPPAISQQEDVEASLDPIERLERRLAKLGGPVAEPELEPRQEDTMSVAAAAPAVASAPELATQQDVVAANRSALLKRIQDAQERARLAQQKLKEKEERERKAKQDQEQKIEEERNISLPPPSYDEIQVMEPLAAFTQPIQQEHQIVSNEDEDAFADERSTMYEKISVLNTPSAPPLAAEEVEDFSNLYPTNAALEGAVVSSSYTLTYHPYPTEDEFPPSYEDFERAVAPPAVQHAVSTDSQDGIGAAFDYDEFGNLVTTDERARMEEEQRAILEQILREREAALFAPSTVSGVSNATTTPSQTVAQHLPPSIPVVQGTVVSQQQQPLRTVEVGPGQRITVHDQSRTREAMQNGTALLVECISCSNWMQITDTATLMFCPCCQSVVPVFRQNAVRTREEAIRLTRDRQLAERLQNEFAGESASANASATAVAAESGSELTFSSLREYVAAFFSTSRGEQEQRSENSMRSILSYPVAARAQTSNSSQIVTSAAATNQPRALFTAQVTGNEEDGMSEETTGLLPARVADPQPNLFSCVEKSFSSVVSSLGRFGLQSEEKEDIDEELLALTERDRLGRDETTSSEYHRLLDYEDER